jgi:hypothetical protein
MRLARRPWAALAGLSAALCAPSAWAEPPRAFVHLEAHGSALDDTSNAALLAPTFGVGLRLGARFDRWRVALHLENDWWVPIEFGGSVDEGAFSVALAGEVLFFDDFLRSSVAVGVSILRYDTLFDEAGSFGPYVDIRPGGLRWSVGAGMHIVFDPLHMAVVYPVTREPELRKLERRTTLGLEATFF